MKFQKFISISIINALVLLVTAVTIASCQKKNIHQSGYFTDYQLPMSGRIPASIAPTIKNGFSNKQDSKQIYIYCYQNSLKVQQCYEHHFNQMLNDFVINNSDINSQTINLLREENKFEIVKQQVELIKQDIISNMKINFDKLVASRYEFCKINAKKNPDRCMTQYLTRDSLALLNSYQFKNKPMNGHEYIYLKNIIQENLKTELTLSAQKIEQDQN